MTWVARIALIAAISLVSGCKMIGSEELTRQRPPVPESSRPGPINTPGLSATGVGREGEPSTTETAAVVPGPTIPSFSAAVYETSMIRLSGS